MQIGVEGGRSTRKNLKLGICGEHGEPSSVKFCIVAELRELLPIPRPVARLAAAQGA